MSGVFELRIHGRGGQGVVTAAELASIAAFEQGRHAHAFPTFGSERTGAPVTSFCRIDERPIRLREPIAEPDAVIVTDATLLHQVDVFGGLGDRGWVLLNSSGEPGELGLSSLCERLGPDRVLAVPATEIAKRHLGRPKPNAALLGALAALTGELSLEAVLTAISVKFDESLAEPNRRAASEAHDHVRRTLPEAARA